MASSSLAFARLSAPSFYFRVSIPWCPQRREWLSGAASSLYHLSCQASTKTQCPQQWRPRAEPSHWWETYRSCSRVVLKKWPRHDVTSGLSPASAVHPFQEHLDIKPAQLTESEQHSNTTTSWPSQWKGTSVSHITFVSYIIYLCFFSYHQTSAMGAPWSPWSTLPILTNPTIALMPRHGSTARLLQLQQTDVHGFAELIQPDIIQPWVRGPRLKRPLVNINSWDGNGIAITTGCNWTEEGKKLTWRKPYPKLVLPHSAKAKSLNPASESKASAQFLEGRSWRCDFASRTSGEARMGMNGNDMEWHFSPTNEFPL